MTGKCAGSSSSSSSSISSSISSISSSSKHQQTQGSSWPPVQAASRGPLANASAISSSSGSAVAVLVLHSEFSLAVDAGQIAIALGREQAHRVRGLAQQAKREFDEFIERLEQEASVGWCAENVSIDEDGHWAVQEQADFWDPWLLGSP